MFFHQDNSFIRAEQEEFSGSQLEIAMGDLIPDSSAQKIPLLRD